MAASPGGGGVVVLRRIKLAVKNDNAQPYSAVRMGRHDTKHVQGWGVVTQSAERRHGWQAAGMARRTQRAARVLAATAPGPGARIMSVYARHFKGQGWGGRIHRRDPKGRDLWPGFWNSINLCFPNFMDRGRAGGSTERTQRGGRLQPLFRGTVPAKICHDHKPRPVRHRLPGTRPLSFGL